MAEPEWITGRSGVNQESIGGRSGVDWEPNGVDLAAAAYAIHSEPPLGASSETSPPFQAFLLRLLLLLRARPRSPFLSFVRRAIR